jgi:hypothetical protein
MPAMSDITGPGKTLKSPAGLLAPVQILAPPSANSRLLYELLGRVSLGSLWFPLSNCMFTPPLGARPKLKVSVAQPHSL